MNARTRVTVVALAAGAAGLAFIGKEPVISVSLLSAVLMIAEFTGGWRAVAAAVVLLTGVSLLIASPLYPLMPVAASALLCARAVRGGAPLVICVLVLAGARVAGDILERGTDNLFQVSPLAPALLEACFNLAVVCLFVMLRPRRGLWLPPTRRWRFEDAMFLAMVAAMTPVALLLSTSSSESLVARDWWLVGLMLGALAATSATSAFTRRVIQALRIRLREGRLRAARRSVARLPYEFAYLFLAARDVSDGLHRRSALQGLHLESARMKAARLQQQVEGQERERRRVDLELQRLRDSGAELDQRWRGYLNTVPEALLITDLSGRIEYANDGVRALLGYAPERLAGTAISAMIPAARSGRDPLDIGGALAEADRSPGERAVRFCDANGALRELSAHVREFRVPQGRRLSIRLREGTGAMQRARDQFVATMSHEIRTPLHGLMATLDMLRGETLSNEGRRQLGIARTSAKTLIRIANDVLDLTRISAGGMPIERKPMSIERLVMDVMDEAKSREEAARLRIRAHVGVEVPVAVLGDPLRIKQVLRNLVSNALKFTTSGGVTVSANWSGGICTIDVKDTGPGIAVDRRESIFEAFVQADRTTARRHGGAGLGLAIGRQLSEAMRGSLSLLESSPEGSTFRLVLPLPETDEAPLEDQSQRNLPAVKGRILVAEDDEASRYVAQTLLESLECPARIVGNGIEALEALRSGEFDLALLDCEMPGLDGYEVTARVRQIGGRHIPIIAMTASTMSADRQRCFDAGMDDLLAKPFGKSALSDMLAKWLTQQPGNSSQMPIAQELAKRPELDPEVFEELRQSLNWQVPPLRKIYQSVRDSARQAIESINGGAPRDRELAHRRLHSLQGGAGLVGARQLEYAAARLLQAMREDSRQEMVDGVPLLQVTLRRFDKVIEDRLDALKTR
jgi:PAS domain S-box-containing protein